MIIQEKVCILKDFFQKSLLIVAFFIFPAGVWASDNSSSAGMMISGQPPLASSFSSVIKSTPPVRLMISASVPAVCQIDREIADASEEKVTLTLDRWCNAPHSVLLNASLDDAPVDGLKLELEGKKIKGSDGEWTLYNKSLPTISKSSLVIKIPKELQGVSGIALNVSIQSEI